MKLIADLALTLKLTVFLVIVSVICSCAHTSIAVHEEPNIIITETGIEAIGTGMSQNGKISNTIAVRLARANLIDYLNIALANTDKDYGIKDVAHKENLLRNSRVIETNQSVRRKNIITEARVRLTFDEIFKWVDLYYDNLPADDMLKTQITKDKFTEHIYIHLHINY